jgi:hypothetical protein
MLISTDSDYLKWYADYTVSWFRQQAERRSGMPSTSNKERLSGTGDGIPFGFTVASHEPIFLIPFFRGDDKHNNNVIITGSVGKSQTSAASSLMLRLLPLGVRGLVVDSANAYQFMSEVIGPELCTRVDLGVNSGIVLNPFDLAPNEITGAPSPKKIGDLLSLIGLMLATEGQEELPAVEKALLDQFICSAYAEALSRSTVPTMSDLVRITRQAGDKAVDAALGDRLQNLALSLSLFTKEGTFGHFLDGATNFDAEKQ